MLFIVFLLWLLAPSSTLAQDTLPQVQTEANEAAWLAEHKEVRLGVDPEFVPFEFIDDGHYLGMCEEYVRLLEGRLGTRMLVTPGLTWKEAVEEAKAREIDVLPCVGMTEERKKYFLYTKPYLSFYRVIITQRDAPAFDTLESMKSVKVGVQQNSSHHGYINDHSDLDPILFDTFEEALLAVSNGKIDAAVGNEAVAAYTINKNNIINLTMSRLAGAEPKNLYLAVRNDWPELVSLLNKGLDSITDEEKTIIKNKWIALKVEKEIDYALVAKISGVILFLVLMLALWNIQIRRQKELLRVSEERFRTLAEATFEGIVLHSDGIIQDLNERVLHMFGYSASEVIGRRVLDFIAPEYHGIAQKRLGKHDGRADEFEGIKKDESRFPIEVRGQWLPAYQGGTVRISAVRDITERKRMEDALMESLRDKEMLIRELNHRIKNNLASIQSLLKLHAKQMTDQEAQGALMDVRSRIRSISLIHEQLSYTTNQTNMNFHEYIEKLATYIFHTYQVESGRISLKINIPNITLDIDKILPCGLIVTELLSNSLKYAFPEGRYGCLSISLEDRGNGCYCLAVSDDGVGLPDGLDLKDEENLPSLGLQLVASLTRQVEGILELDRSSGTRFMITFEEKPFPFP